MAPVSTALLFRHVNTALALTDVVQVMEWLSWLHCSKGNVRSSQDEMSNQAWLCPVPCKCHCCQAGPQAVCHNVQL